MTTNANHQALYILRGPSGSGKSTLAMSLKLHNKEIEIVEADMFFIDKETGEYNFEALQLGAAHKWCYETVLDFLREGKSVIVANVNYQLKHFQLYLQAAEKMNIPVFVMLVEGNFRGEEEQAKVPDSVVARQKRLWETYSW